MRQSERKKQSTIFLAGKNCASLRAIAAKPMNMKRILIIEVNWIGDVLFTTPAIRAIRENNPGAFIAAMVVPRCVEMLEGNPHINEIIIYDEAGAHKGLFGKLAFVRQVKAMGFDIAVSFHRSMTRMLLAYLAGIPRRAGYATLKRSWLLTDPVRQPDKLPHRVEYFLDIAKAVGAQTANRDYEFFIPEEATERADALLKNIGISKDDKFFVINPGGNWPQKRWPKENYAKLAAELKRIYGKDIVITGSQSDIPLAEEIIKQSNDSAKSLCGRTSLKELGAVLKRADLVAANDSGPMHVAVSQRAPTIALFGPTSPGITGPYGSSDYIVLSKWGQCEVPCFNLCKTYRCMEAITVDDVLAAADKLLEKR